MTNLEGVSVTDYTNETNNVIFKTLPVMDFMKTRDVFFRAFGDGMFDSSKTFRYSHCVVDLNPTASDYENLPVGKFPMQFVNGISVNESDEYKTSKIVLTRISDISAGKFATFGMGSRSTDYDQVTSESRIRYSDAESILGQAKQDVASVTLGNGG